MSYPKLYDVVTKPDGDQIACAMSLDEAITVMRRWNRDNATSQRWATCQAQKPEPVTVAEQVQVQPIAPPAGVECEPEPDDLDDETERTPFFVPTPEDIRAACLEIQAGWSRTERLRRAARDELRTTWRMPVCRTGGVR